MQLSYAIVFVSDMPRSIAFYRDVLGLPLRFESPEWTEFVAGGATLALHRANGSAEQDERWAAPGRCRPGLRVPNLDDFHDRMARHGVVCLQEPTQVFGDRIAQYADPDGLPISVGENPS